MPSAAGSALARRIRAADRCDDGRFGIARSDAGRFGAVARGDADRFASGFCARAFAALRGRDFGAAGRFLAAAFLRATIRFATGADFAAVVFFRAVLARTLARTAAFRAAAAFSAPPFPAARAALAFFRACLAAFLLAFANFRARLSSAFASRNRCFAVSARATAFFASARNRCAAPERFASFPLAATTMQGLARKMVGG